MPALRASQKFHALARISKFLDTDRIVLMMNTFVMSKFSYCPLISMFHDIRINNKVNKIHERALRIAYKDSHSCFESLLERNRPNSVSLHQRNLQLLLVKIFKTKEKLNPSFTKNILVERTENYNLRSGNTLQLPKARTTTYGESNLYHFFMTKDLTFEFRKVWSKFRCSDHALLIEVGRHKGLQVEQRLCKICNLNLVEDEFHFLTICPAYNKLRAVLLSAANVMLLDPEIQFSTIMSGENTTVIRRLAEFILDAKKMRDSFETAI